MLWCGCGPRFTREHRPRTQCQSCCAVVCLSCCQEQSLLRLWAAASAACTQVVPAMLVVGTPAMHTSANIVREVAQAPSIMQTSSLFYGEHTGWECAQRSCTAQAVVFVQRTRYFWLQALVVMYSARSTGLYRSDMMLALCRLVSSACGRLLVQRSKHVNRCKERACGQRRPETRSQNQLRDIRPSASESLPHELVATSEHSTSSSGQ